MRYLLRLALFAVLLLIPVTAVSAQGLGAIAGTVRDSSGALLPGVTVEAASPALIEKVRSAVTDGSGQYTIVSLPVGAYTVTFTLTGFSAVRRDGVQTLASFTATVNAELGLGTLQETVTVSGEAPVVDVRSAAATRAATADIIRAIPNGGDMFNLAAMYTGVTMSGTAVDVGGQTVLSFAAQLSAHGGRAGDNVQMLDGIKIGNLQLNGGRTGFTLSPLLWDQVDVVLSGQSGESPSLGVQTNAIPRSGGNTFSGTVLANGANTSLQSSNLTDRLRRSSPDLTRIEPWGTSSTGNLKVLYDVNASQGGPILRDRIWYYGTGRYITSQTYVADHYFPVDPTARIRVEDRSRPVVSDQYLWDATLRLTVAITPKMRATQYSMYQHRWYNHDSISPSVSPEATGKADWPRKLFQGAWTYTPTNRLLFEAGANWQQADFTVLPRPGDVTGPRVVETGGTFNGVAVKPMTYGAMAGRSYDPDTKIQAGRASASYVTGSHNFKAGLDYQTGYRLRHIPNFANNIQYRTTNYVLNQVTVFAPPDPYRANLNYNLGLYAQDRWTLGRLSVSPAVRFELMKQSYEAYRSPGASTYLPTRLPVSFPAADVVSWRDVNPRLGVAYDLFGDGKTAFKASAGRGVEQEAINTLDRLTPANAFATSTARTVDDRTFPEGDPRRLNGVPDCNLTIAAANGECGPWLTSGFGAPTPITQQDPRTLRGWGVRPSNWEFSAGVQHELMPRVSVDAAYYRRMYGGFLVTDNTANTAADFTRFQLATPNDARLPNAGRPLTVYDINPVLASGRPFNTTANLLTFASDYGDMYERWNGFDLTMNARLQSGATIHTGVSTGRRVFDNCEVVAKLPEVLGNTPADYCHTQSGWEPQYKLVGTLPLPWNVRVSGNWYSRPGAPIQASAIYSGAQIAPALGRAFSAGATGQKSVDVLAPATAYGDRLNQVDLRFSRIFRFGGTSLDANVDLYNALNSDAALAYTTSYSGANGGAWLRPTSIVQGRMVKFDVRWNY